MFFEKLTLAAVAVAATGAFAGSAQAAIVESDNVRLTSVGYDFGGNTWALGAPTGSGELHFHHENGQIRPHLVGALHLNDADGTCGRMKLEHYDADGNFLSSEYSPSRCVDDDRHHAFAVDMDSYEDNEIAHVTVRLQRQTAGGWQNVADDATGIFPDSDDVSITEDGVDFGSSGFALGQPRSWGSVHWSLEDGWSPRVCPARSTSTTPWACAPG